MCNRLEGKRYPPSGITLNRPKQIPRQVSSPSSLLLGIPRNTPTVAVLGDGSSISRVRLSMCEIQVFGAEGCRSKRGLRTEVFIHISMKEKHRCWFRLRSFSFMVTSSVSCKVGGRETDRFSNQYLIKPSAFNGRTTVRESPGLPCNFGRAQE